MTFWAFCMGTSDEVEHFGDGAESLITGIFVFIHYKLIGAFDGCRTERWDCAMLIGT